MGPTAEFWDALARLLDNVVELVLFWGVIEVMCATILRDRSPERAKIESKEKQ